MLIKWTVPAMLDVERITQYLLEHECDAALAVFIAARLFQAVERLAPFPFSGRDSQTLGVKEVVLKKLPYIITYRVTDCVEILSVTHMSRDVIQ